MAYVVAQGISSDGKIVGPHYCQDGLNRFYAHWGTEPNCIKVYTKKSWAEKRAKEQNKWATIKSWTVVDLNEYNIDSSGIVQP